MSKVINSDGNWKLSVGYWVFIHLTIQKAKSLSYFSVSPTSPFLRFADSPIHSSIQLPFLQSERKRFRLFACALEDNMFSALRGFLE